MHRGIISLVLSTCLAAIATAAAQAQPAPESKAPEAPPPPMVFYIAKGEPGACGPGCQEWIAAEGYIDRNAEPRLWELLRKIGNDRKPPVYFQSNGGAVIAALELGRLLRARGLSVGVGLTVPTGCDRRNPADAACDALKRSGRELAAELDPLSGGCASSCVYAILGGAVRDIGAGVRLGIHDTRPAATVKRFNESGKVVDTPQILSVDALRRGQETGQQMIALYLKKMGISADLLTAAHAVSADKLRLLTRAEIVAFGIDRRTRVEGAWSLVDKPSGVSAVKLVEARQGEGGPFRTEMLTLACHDTVKVRLQYLHEVAAGDEREPKPLRLIADGSSFPLAPLGSVAQGEDGPRFESHGVDLPLAVLDAAAFVIATSETSGQSPDGPPPDSARRLAVQGGAPALAALGRRCVSGSR